MQDNITIPIAYNRIGQRIGGLNKNDEPVGFSGQFSPYMKNFVVESSCIRKRLGYNKLGTNLPLSGTGAGLYKYVDATGVSHLIALTSTNAYEYNATLDAWDDISPETVRTVYTPDSITIQTPDGQSLLVSEPASGTSFTGGEDNKFRFAVVTDSTAFTNNGGTAAVLTNGIDDLYFYEGNAGCRLATLTHAFPNFANCLDIVEFYNHFFLFNYNDGSQRARGLAFAEAGDVTSWSGPTASATTLTDSVGSVSRALKLGLYLIIYSTESISICEYIGGSTIFSIPTVFYQAGLISPGAVWPFTDYHIFIGSDQRVHKYAGSNRSDDVGYRVDCALFSEMDYEHKDRIVAGYDSTRKKLYFFIPTPSSVTPKSAYVLSPDMYGEPWEYHEFADTVCSMAVLEAKPEYYCDDTTEQTGYCDEATDYCDSVYSQSGAPICVFLSSDSYVYKLDESTGKDDDSDITCEYQTEDITVDEEITVDRWNWLSFVARSDAGTDVYLSYSTDDGKTWTFAADSPISISEGWNTYRVPIDVASRKIRIKFYESSSSDFRLRESVRVGYTTQEERE